MKKTCCLAISRQPSHRLSSRNDPAVGWRPWRNAKPTDDLTAGRLAPFDHPRGDHWNLDLIFCCTEAVRWCGDRIMIVIIWLQNPGAPKETLDRPTPHTGSALGITHGVVLQECSQLTNHDLWRAAQIGRVVPSRPRLPIFALDLLAWRFGSQ